MPRVDRLKPGRNVMHKDKNWKSSAETDSRPNKLCRRCVRTCRQSDLIVLVDCPRFQPRPFKVKEPPGDQLELFRPGKKK
jgi:hypothetical protein